MGLLDFKKPKYRHKDPAVRLAAVGEIDPAESEILVDLSVNDPDRQVRRAAIERVTEPAVLGRLIEAVPPEERPVVVARKDLLLCDLILSSTDLDVCSKNLREISSPELLARIAVNHSLTEIRREAVDRIEDQQVLADVLEQNIGKDPARTAMAKISDEALLSRLSESAASKIARQQAAARLTQLEEQRNQPSRDEIIRQTLADLANEAAALFSFVDIDEAAARLAEIKEEWRKLDPGLNHSDYPAFVRTCEDFAVKYREIEERRVTEREKVARYEELQAGLEEVYMTIERLTGSSDAGAEAEKERAVSTWKSLVKDAEGKAAVSAALTKKFATACRSFEQTSIKVRHEKEQLDVVEQECQTVKELIEQSDLKKAERLLAGTEKKLSLIKFKYFSRTAAEKLLTETAEQLNRTRKNEYEENLAYRRKICEELNGLTDQFENGTEQRLEDLRKHWQELAKLDGTEAEKLEERFQKGLAELTEKLQNFKAEKDWQLWANLTLKEKLTEKVEALEQEDDLATVFETVTKAQAEWKEIGPIPPKKAQKLWERFHSACNLHFARTEPYLEERKAEREAAMERRREICDLATELAESNEWRKTTDILKGLQKEWQDLMPGPRNEERKLHKKFRQACDRFFERRKEEYRQREEERRQYLHEKEKLCEEAERLVAEPLPEYSKKFRDLQAAWKKVGPAPKKEADKIWKRFRAACDKYFAWLDEERQSNLVRKEELCLEAEKLVAEGAENTNQKEIAARLAGLQERWKEIGPAPQTQNEAVWQRFRSTCDSFFKARLERVEKDKGEKAVNQARKEKLLAKAEEMTIDQAIGGVDKQTSTRLQELQEEWQKIGAASREADRELNERFGMLCDAFLGGRSQYFIDLKKQQLENQKKKESLCLRLENILGTAHKSVTEGRDKALSLADELKQAMEDNFMLAGRRNEKKAVQEEVERIEQDWQKIGSVPYARSGPLAARFKKALDLYYKGQR